MSGTNTTDTGDESCDSFPTTVEVDANTARTALMELEAAITRTQVDGDHRGLTPLARVKEGLDDELDLSNEDRAAVEGLIDDVAEETGEPADPHDPLTAYTFEARTELRRKLEGTDEESVDLPLGRSVPTATIEEGSSKELQLKLVGDSVTDNAIVDTVADPGKYALVPIRPSCSSPLRAAVTITGEGIGANLYGPDAVRDSMWLTWAGVFEQADSDVVSECLDSLTSSLDERAWTLED